jgi:hypothetical protein
MYCACPGAVSAEPTVAPVGYLEVGGRAVLIVVFAVAAVGTLRARPAWHRFRAAVAALTAAPAPLVTAVAVAVVAGEAAVVPALLANRHPVGAAVAAATGALAGLLVSWLDDLVELFTGRPVGLARTD